jgi:hypothetical protein
MIAVYCLLLLIIAPSVTSLSGCATAPHVQVFDNVLASHARQLLHQVASSDGLSHKLLDRSSSATRSPLEDALHDILVQLNDTSPYVEYWCRDSWRSIEAHADVDENLAKTKQQQDLRYPTHGHVLYLSIGVDVRGPTCLFEDCQSGGDLARAKDNVTLVTVPAVEGRLLRFDGHLLHAVPRPTDLWLLPFVQGSPDLTSPQFQRSVVLFNTWQQGEAPLDVPQRRPEGACPDDDDEPQQDNPEVHAKDDWNEMPVEPSPSPVESPEPRKRTKIWLLGDLTRRNHEMRTVNLYSVERQLREALYHPSKPRRTSLFQQQ